MATNNEVILVDSDATDPLPSSDDEEAAAVPPPPVVTITTLTDCNGTVIPRTVGRPRTTLLRFTAVTSDPFESNTGKLYFVIRGKPAVKKRPGLGNGNLRYNSTSELEREFLDVSTKLILNKKGNPNSVKPNFERSPLHIQVDCYFPREYANKMLNANGVGDCNNLLNFVQDSLQRNIFHDDAQITDAHVTKAIGEEYGS